MKKDRVQEIKDNLLRIGVQDTRRVIEANAALSRMAALGFKNEDLPALLRIAPQPEPSEEVVWPLPEEAVVATDFHGFRDRKQCAMAYYYSMPKAQRPAGLEDSAKRVEVFIKNQEPERRGVDIGLALVIPARMEAADQKALPAIRMRRTADGKLKPIVDDEVIDVEAEVESTVVYLERKRNGR